MLCACVGSLSCFYFIYLLCQASVNGDMVALGIMSPIAFSLFALIAVLSTLTAYMSGVATVILFYFILLILFDVFLLI